MGLQDQWSVEDPGNVGVLANRGITGGNSAYLTGSITKYNGMLVISYDTDNGLVQWHIFVWDEANLTYHDVTNPDHLHNTDQGEGGGLLNIFADRQNAGILFFNDITPMKENYNENTFSGTGSAIANSFANRRFTMSTGTTTGGYATVAAHGQSVDCDFIFRFNGVWVLSAITNVLFRFGVGVEDPNAAPDNNPKLGVEWCDSQATSKYYALSANGSSRSLVDAGVSLVASTAHGLRLVNFPASKGEYTFHGGVIYDKTGVLPTSSGFPQVRWGLKNNNGGAANRDWQVYGTSLVFNENDSNWIDSA